MQNLSVAIERDASICTNKQQLRTHNISRPLKRLAQRKHFDCTQKVANVRNNVFFIGVGLKTDDIFFSFLMCFRCCFASDDTCRFVCVCVCTALDIHQKKIKCVSYVRDRQQDKNDSSLTNDMRYTLYRRSQSNTDKTNRKGYRRSQSDTNKKDTNKKWEQKTEYSPTFLRQCSKRGTNAWSGSSK